MRRFVQLLALILAFSVLVGGALAWESQDQTARNDIKVGTGFVDIDPPILEKVVQGSGAPIKRFQFLLKGEPGAPMPEGSTENRKWLYLDGAGTVEIGTFRFTQPGVYKYTVTEEAGTGGNWTYDGAVYDLTFTVTEEDGVLTVHRELKRNGTAADRLVFYNRYTPSRPVHTPKVTPTPKPDVTPTPTPTPDVTPTPTPEITVTPTPLPGITPTPEVTPTPETTPTPTPDVVPTPDITPPPPSEPPTDPPSPTPPTTDVAKTGDTNELNWWLVVTISGVVGVTVCLGYLFWQTHHYVGKRLKRR